MTEIIIYGIPFQVGTKTFSVEEQVHIITLRNSGITHKTICKKLGIDASYCPTIAAIIQEHDRREYRGALVKPLLARIKELESEVAQLRESQTPGHQYPTLEPLSPKPLRKRHTGPEKPIGAFDDTPPVSLDAIRRLIDQGYSNSRLASHFGKSEATIHRLKRQLKGAQS